MEVHNLDHTIVHFEIPAKDVEKLKKFYTGVFGWKITKAPGPIEYWLIGTVPVDEKMSPTRPGVNGGMYKKEQAKLKPVNYFSVESIDDFIKKIKASGGKMIGPKQEVTNVGWIALAVDPEGNQFAIMQLKRA
jgi:predicted enzyme related to lactoylglutathione lyase